MTTAPVGTFCLVLHSHLPWLAHHGTWPVGEEWLHQAWAGSYLRVVDLLDRLGREGRREVLTLGVTPVLAAQLDDPYLLAQFHTWLTDWQLRAGALAGRGDSGQRALARVEHRAAADALATFTAGWCHGGSPPLRRLVDDGVVELLGGPATHPFQPLLPGRLIDVGLDVGLADATVRLGRRPAGLWAPECAYRPGLEEHYARAGVERVVVDGPTLQAAGHDTASGRPLGSTDVIAFGRDLDVSYRVWSPRRGYPGGRWYRDFHTFDHGSGLRLARVTSTATPPDAKAPYHPDRAASAALRDAEDFVTTVRGRLLEHADRLGHPGLVVAAFDTELFGHWWHEGPDFLEHVLRALPAAGIHVTTLQGAVAAGHVGDPVELGPGSWGSGKDWRVWQGPAVADLTATHDRVAERLLTIADRELSPGEGRRHALDQLTRDALLALASDWTFMVSKESAAEYARARVADHAEAFDRLAAAIDDGAWQVADRLAAEQRRRDGPFGLLDARLLAERPPGRG